MSPDSKSAKPKGFIPTKRDVEIVLAVADRRALTTPQIDDLFFPTKGESRVTGVSSRCQARLKVLAENDYIESREQPTLLTEGRKPRIHLLSTKGAKVYQDETGKKADWSKQENDVTPRRLEHLIQTNWLRIYFELSARAHGWSIEEWLDDRTLKRMQPEMAVEVKMEGQKPLKTAVTPDGYFRLVVPTEEGRERVYHMFVECDLGNTTGVSSVWGRRDYRHKILAYNAFVHSGKYEALFEAKTMRVMTVTTSEERADYLKKLTEEAGGKARFWFTSFDRFDHTTGFADPLDHSIWQVASKLGYYSPTALG